MAGESKSSARRIEATDKQRRAVELRKAGASFRQIADQLGYSSVAGAHKAVMTALQKTLQEPADALRTLELERLDALMLPLWKRARGDVDKGIPADLRAVDRIVKLMERRARLLGLDAPTKIAPTNLDGTAGATLTIEVSDARERLARLIADHAARSGAGGDSGPTDDRGSGGDPL